VKDIKTNGQRAIFDGNTEFDEFEQVLIIQFQDYAEKNKYHLKPM